MVNKEFEISGLTFKTQKCRKNVWEKLWHFLTGNKEKLYEVARKSFFLLKKSEVENQGDVGTDFIALIRSEVILKLSYLKKWSRVNDSLMRMERKIGPDET